MDRSQTLQTLLAQIRASPDLDAVAKAYLFARFSVQNQLKRHESAYEAFIAAHPTHAAIEACDVLAAIQPLGLNFWRAIARDVEAAMPHLSEFLSVAWPMPDKDAREWVAENMPGLGYAKASFFLMLQGRLDVGCIDVHMGGILGVKKPSQLRTRKGYERFERKLGQRAGLAQWLRWIDFMGISGVGHEGYFASQGVLN